MSVTTPPSAGSGGAPPDLGVGVTVDEGPMRRELLRQIRELEGVIAQFQADNFPFRPPVVSSPSRGPAVLSTASLEEIRDELISSRARLHEMLVERASAAFEPEPERPRRWWRRG